MCRGIHDAHIALPTAVPAVLADSLLQSFFLFVGRILLHIQQYISESVQSCDASKQLLQGEKQQKFYAQIHFIALHALIFSNLYCLYIFLGKLLYLTFSSPVMIS
jgi:hypothetical protein